MTYPKGKMIKGTIGFYEYKHDVKNDNEKDPKIMEKDRKYQEKLHFYGIFGSLFVFDEIFNYEILSKIFELGEDYEMLLYRNFNFLYDLDEKKMKIIKSIAEADNHKLENKLICLISPNVYITSNL